jgi:hypothetical protein
MWVGWVVATTFIPLCSLHYLLGRVVVGAGWFGLTTFFWTTWMSFYAAVRSLGFQTCVRLRCCTFSWTSTHASCYAALRSLGLPRIRHARLLYVLFDFHTCVMLRRCTFFWTSTHSSYFLEDGMRRKRSMVTRKCLGQFCICCINGSGVKRFQRSDSVQLCFCRSPKLY